MTVASFGTKKASDPARPAPPLHSHSDYGQITAASSGHVQAGGNAGVQNPIAIFQHIQDLSAKRISTLDYLRKAYASPQAAVSDLGKRY